MLGQKKTKRVLGFSLAELMVALGMIAAMSLVVFALFLQLVKGAEKQTHLAAGVVLAEELMTERLQVIFNDAEPGLTKDDFFSTDSPPNAPLQGTMALGTTTYTYEMNYETVTNTFGDEVGGDPAANNRLKRVDITIWWWTGDPEEARQGYGLLRAGSSRFVNEQMDFNV